MPEQATEDRSRRRPRRPSLAVALGVGLLWCTAIAADALGQVQRRLERAVRTADPTFRLPVDPSLSLVERSEIDVGGFASFSFVHLVDSENNARRLAQPEVTLYGRFVLDGAHRAFVRARAQYRAFSEGDSFDERGDTWTEPWLERYWYEFDLASAMTATGGAAPDVNLNVRVGRQFVDWGAGLALSEQLLAARATVTFGPFDILGLAGVTPTDRSVIDFDASRDGFDHDTERAFFGGQLRYTTERTDTIYAYVLHMADWNSDRPRAAIVGDVDFDYDATYVGIGASGPIGGELLYLGEFVYEFGESTSDPLQGPQRREDIRAFAARGQLTYVRPDLRGLRVEGEIIAASGDDDRFVSTDTIGGNAPGTDDTGFNSLGYANTGLAFAPSLSNLLIFRAGASAFPFQDVAELEQFQVGVDLLLHNKLDADAPIDEPTNDDMFLGFETDVFVNWRIFSDLAVTARYGVFFPGDGIAAETDVRHFVFLGATLSF